ncbi:hypothetical protein [Flavobacterium sp.]|uniref:hypothetical protein n=1 Tax=Flavobacterium sp. TaxID=239 RepID=UPI00286E310F|nr:hypothetical protein [Flavobacterium sp.]
MFSKNFTTLLNEAQFTSEILASGVTQIGKVNYAKKGIYFSSFTSLATGIERIGKLSLIVDYYLTHDGTFPDENTLKNDFGHDLEKLYHKSKEIIARHNLDFNFLENLDSQIHQDILSILSRFAKGDRYSNINFIVQSKSQSDPVSEWYTKVENEIYNSRVTDYTKNKILENAKFVNEFLGGNSMVLFSSETGGAITTIEESSIRTGMANANRKYRQLYVAQIIRYWVEILRGLNYITIKSGSEDIPYFTEMFPLFLNNDTYLLTRKDFEKLR